VAEDRAIEIRPEDIVRYQLDLYEDENDGVFRATKMNKPFQVENIYGRLEAGMSGDYLVVDASDPQNLMAAKREHFEKDCKKVEPKNQTIKKMTRPRPKRISRSAK
jgi:hypothetical protein